MKNCPFCYPNPDLVLMETHFGRVIINAQPAVPGHVLITPREHVCKIGEMDFLDWDRLCALTRQAARILKGNLKHEGMNVWLNEGRVAGQTIPHLHFHVALRTEGDNLINMGRRENERKKISPDEIQLLRSWFE